MQLVASASGRAEREYLPRGECLAWDPWLLGLHVTADVLIFGAFTAIATAILIFVRRREMQFSIIGWLFASFIFLAGLAQIASFATLWWPIYDVHIVIKLLAAGVSLFAAYMAFRLLPRHSPSRRKGNTRGCWVSCGWPRGRLSSGLGSALSTLQA